MKREEFTPCIVCGKGVAHDGAICFYRVRAERTVLDFNAIRRAHGLELMVGSPKLAAVFDPGDELAKAMPDSPIVLVCDDCALHADYPVAALYENACERARAAAREQETTPTGGADGH